MISDLLTDREPCYSKDLSSYGNAGMTCLCYTLWTTTNWTFRLEGPHDLRDLESEDALNCNPKALREGYLEALNEFLDEDPTYKCAKRHRLPFDSDE